ncbi:MAG TPA: thiol-disulfide oxidoreductase DCC family protein [Flavipsychrobacter sp.]|nr:thiol-disulfide oxidoreductase DCC family protein [Flavipsychrobacter sp.]
MDTDKSILYFDGVCNLCNRLVIFFIERDKEKKILFASLQSPAGQKALEQSAQQLSCEDSVLLYHDGKYYQKSTAIIKALSMLGGVWRLSLVAYILPVFLRNKLYDFFAKNRYRWFGKKEECMLPTPELRSRFLN